MSTFIEVVVISGISGGVGASVAVVIQEAIRHFFSKDIEAHKTKQILRGKILDLKLNCLSALIDHKYRFYPAYDYPDKDWDVAQEEIIDNFGNLERDITLICRKYLSVLKKSDQDVLERLINAASSGKFEIGGNGKGVSLYSKTGREYADEYFDKLQSLIGNLTLELNT